MPTTVSAYWSANRFTPLYRGANPVGQSVRLPASVNYAAGTLLGEVTATPGTYKAYASGNVDGSQNPQLILEYACSTDASGNITISGDFAQTYQSAPAFAPKGITAKTQEIVGLDAGAVTALRGVVIEGTTAVTPTTWNGTTLTLGSTGIIQF